MRDQVQERLVEIIDAKKKSVSPARRKPQTAEEAGTPNNVINIMDALRRSVAAETKKK